MLMSRGVRSFRSSGCWNGRSRRNAPLSISMRLAPPLGSACRGSVQNIGLVRCWPWASSGVRAFGLIRLSGAVTRMMTRSWSRQRFAMRCLLTWPFGWLNWRACAACRAGIWGSPSCNRVRGPSATIWASSAKRKSAARSSTCRAGGSGFVRSFGCPVSGRRPLAKSLLRAVVICGGGALFCRCGLTCGGWIWPAIQCPIACLRCSLGEIVVDTIELLLTSCLRTELRPQETAGRFFV